MNSLFLDTNFVVALNLRSDQSYSAASRYWATALNNRQESVTTTFVLDEAVTFLNSRGQHALAVAVGAQLLHSPVITLVHIDAPLLERGWNYFVRHHDKRYSLTDCISFVVMQERGLRQALTFDQHFAQAGFECVPEAGFEG